MWIRQRCLYTNNYILYYYIISTALPDHDLYEVCWPGNVHLPLCHMVIGAALQLHSEAPKPYREVTIESTDPESAQSHTFYYRSLSQTDTFLFPPWWVISRTYKKYFIFILPKKTTKYIFHLEDIYVIKTSRGSSVYRVGVYRWLMAPWWNITAGFYYSDNRWNEM